MKQITGELQPIDEAKQIQAICLLPGDSLVSQSLIPGIQYSTTFNYQNYMWVQKRVEQG